TAPPWSNQPFCEHLPARWAGGCSQNEAGCGGRRRALVPSSLTSVACSGPMGRSGDVVSIPATPSPLPANAARRRPFVGVRRKAPTGSGKTLAFGIPLAERVSRARVARPRALVLAPTRELASQIHGELAPLLHVRKRSVGSFYGGVSFVPQLKLLRRGVDVVVA